MPTLVPHTSQPQELAAHLVGDPVSATSAGRVWATQAAFLLGRALHHVASIRYHAITRTSSAVDIPIQWRPSPGCRVALLTVDLGQALAVNITGRYISGATHSTLALTLPAGAGAITMDGRAFDGSAGMPEQDILRVARASYACLIHLGDAGDVADQIHDVTLTIDDVGTEQHAGVAQVTLTELPLGTLAPEDGEVGVHLPAIDPRNELHDGDSSTGTGVPEILTAEQDAAVKIREHVQVGTYEDTGLAWTRSSAVVGALNWVGTFGTAYDPTFRVRVRAPHGNTTGLTAAFTLRVRYYSTAQGTFRVVKSPVGLGVSANHDFVIASGAGAWTASADTTLTLRTDGTDQEIDLQFHAATDDGSALYVSSIALIQTETA